jgi:hypothetical protein
MNVDHIAEHGLNTDDYERLFRSASDHDRDRDHPDLGSQRGRLRGIRYRLIYAILDGTVVFPITGFPISRRGLR